MPRKKVSKGELSMEELSEKQRKLQERRHVEQLVWRQAGAWMAADVERIVADYAPDGRLISPGGCWQGHKAIREACRRFFKSEKDIQVHIERLVWDMTACQGAVEWQWSAVDEKGRAYKDEEGIVFALDEQGQITYWRQYFDQNSRLYNT